MSARLTWKALAALALSVLVSTTATATPPSKCSGSKVKAAGKKAASKLTCLSKGVAKGLGTDSTCLAKAEVKFSTTVAKTEAKTYTDGGCLVLGEAPGVEATVDGLLANVDGLVDGATPPGRPCDGAKVKAAAKKVAAKLTCHAKAVTKGLTVDSTCLAKAEVKFSSAVAKAEAKSGGSDCSHTGDAASYEALVDAAVGDVDVQMGICPADGVRTGPACWYFGSLSDSCTTTCTNGGLVYDTATASYAGSGGTDAACNAVLDALGVTAGNIAFTAADCGLADECILAIALNNDTQRVRCTHTPPDPNSSSQFHRRACACVTTTTTTTTSSTSSTTLPALIVFVTSGAANGAFGGLANADLACNAGASFAGLPGTYKAWVSDSTGSPSTRFTQSAGPYKLVNGTTIANNWADLTDGTLAAPINVTEAGNTLPTSLVWTDTNADGTVTNAANGSCFDWTSSSSSDAGFIGETDQTNSQWTSIFIDPCDTALHLYCFQQ